MAPTQPPISTGHREQRGQQRIVRADELPAVADLLLHGQVGAVEVAVPLLGALVADVEVEVLAEADRGQQVLRLVGGQAATGGGGVAAPGAHQSVTPARRGAAATS